MGGWRNRRNQKRKHHKSHFWVNFLDILIDVLLWIPELILLPFRFIFWILRGLLKVVGNIIDFN